MLALLGVAVVMSTMHVQPPAAAQFDHLVVAIRSLPEGIAEFERLTGIKAGVGGKHPGRGTENALISFGGRKYLEIIAPQAGVSLSPRDEAMRSLERLHIIDWAVSVNSVERAVDTLRTAGFATTPAQPGARVTPAGERLEWTTFGLADRGIAVAPFFINWHAGTKHPATTAPGGCELATLTIADPASDRLAKALGALGVPEIAYVKGAPRIEARVKCGDRTVKLTNP